MNSRQMKPTHIAAVTIAVGAFLILLGRASASEQKTHYTLFNPTPVDLLRDISTDRPDLTETPFTIDAGHVQFEATLVGYSRSRPEPDGTFTRSFDFFPVNVRIGITNYTEFGVVVRPYGLVHTYPGDGTARTRSSGMGGIDFRGKINFWGNDTFENPGSTALGLLPFVTIPTDKGNGISPEKIEAGVVVPFALKLTDKIGVGLNAGVHLVPNENRGGRHVEYLASASFSYEWSERLGTYYEVAARLNTGDERGDIVAVATGLTYKLNDNLQLDAGINIGVTRAADRYNPFVGLSARF
jgi:hypothetical protein